MYHKKGLKAVVLILWIVVFVVMILGLAVVAVASLFNIYRVPSPALGESWSKRIHEDITADLYVSTLGSDDNEGTKDRPFLTIDRAIRAVRDLDKAGREEIVVAVEEGTYYTKPLTLSAGDGGGAACKIKYVAVGEVTVNLGTTINPQDFVNVARYPDIEKRVPKDARGRIMVVDLTSDSYGLTSADWGGLYPIGTYNTASRYQGDTEGPMYSELFIDDKRQILARYPNEDYAYVDEVVSVGKDSRAQHRSSDPSGDIIKVDALTAERIASWQNISDVWMYGFLQYDWADGSTPLTAFNAATKELTTKYQSFFGVKKGAPYYFYNCLEELDSEGEWYLDRGKGLLCIYAPNTILDSEITFATSLSPILDIRCDNVSFDGFTFTGTRRDGITAYGNRITLANCTVKNVSGSGILMEGSDNEIYCCEIFDVGRDGISVSGGERRSLKCGNNRVYNNLIHDWAEIYKTYSAGVRLGGVGNVCANNELYSAPHLAITYAGNYHVIEYNRIHDVCRETNDAGAIYAGKSWASYGNEIRYNCIYNLGTEGYTPNGIYMDDAISGQSIYGNILINIPQNAIFIGGGRDMRVSDNLIINCGQYPIFYDARAREATIGSTWFTEDIHELLRGLHALPWQSDIWRENFPQYQEISADLSQIDSPNCIVNPANSIITNNLIFHKKREVGSLNEYVKNYGTVQDNRVYHLSMMPFFFKGFSKGEYILRMEKVDCVQLSEIGRY